MSRNFKTSLDNRVNYIYYTAEGSKIVITPDESGITEADVERLHAMDDTELNEQRRYDYRVTTHLDAYHDAKDRNKYLADDSTNPERLYLAKEEEQDHLELLERLSEALKMLQPQQQDLYRKVYVERRSCTEISRDEGVSEAAIRNRLKKIQNRIKNQLS